jgi:hypothetical protein
MRRKLHEARFIQHSSVLANLPDALQDHGYVPTSRPNLILPHPPTSLPLFPQCPQILRTQLRAPNLPHQIRNANLLARLLVVVEPLALVQLDRLELGV